MIKILQKYITSTTYVRILIIIWLGNKNLLTKQQTTYKCIFWVPTIYLLLVKIFSIKNEEITILLKSTTRTYQFKSNQAYIYI